MCASDSSWNSPKCSANSAKLFPTRRLSFGKDESLLLVNFRALSAPERRRKLVSFASIFSCASPAIKMSVSWWTGCRDHHRWVGRWGGRGGWWGSGRGGGGGEGGGGRGRWQGRAAKQVAEKKKKLSLASLSCPFSSFPLVSPLQQQLEHWAVRPLSFPPVSMQPRPRPPRQVDFAWRWHYLSLCLLVTFADSNINLQDKYEASKVFFAMSQAPRYKILQMSNEQTSYCESIARLSQTYREHCLVRRGWSVSPPPSAPPSRGPSVPPSRGPAGAPPSRGPGAPPSRRTAGESESQVLPDAPHCSCKVLDVLVWWCLEPSVGR